MITSWKKVGPSRKSTLTLYYSSRTWKILSKWTRCITTQLWMQWIRKMKKLVRSSRSLEIRLNQQRILQQGKMMTRVISTRLLQILKWGQLIGLIRSLSILETIMVKDSSCIKIMIILKLKNSLTEKRNDKSLWMKSKWLSHLQKLT